MRPQPPTYMQFKRHYVQGDQRLGEKRRSKADRRLEKKLDNEKGVEMTEMGGGNAPPSTVGFQGPRGRGMINNTPRSEG